MSETIDYGGRTLSGAIFSGSFAGLLPLPAQSNVQTFEGPGAPVAVGGTFTWVKPPSGSQVLVECWGGGGAGSPLNNGGGGGGGGYTSNILPFSAVSATVAVSVGVGGVIGSPASGGNSTFGPYGTGTITGYGGSSGQPASGGGGGGMAGAGGPISATAGAQGGGTGGPSPLINATIYGGGGGGNQNVSGGTSVYGGGGGGGGGNSNAPGGVSVYGGPGGSFPAGAGVIPGGGGTQGAIGASGRVRVTVF